MGVFNHMLIKVQFQIVEKKKKRKKNLVRLRVIFSSYFLTGFFCFPLAFLGNILSSNFFLVDFLFKFLSVTNQRDRWSEKLEV
jgi:hypothetical protein